MNPSPATLLAIVSSTLLLFVASCANFDLASTNQADRSNAVQRHRAVKKPNAPRYPGVSAQDPTYVGGSIWSDDDPDPAAVPRTGTHVETEEGEFVETSPGTGTHLETEKGEFVVAPPLPRPKQPVKLHQRALRPGAPRYKSAEWKPHFSASD